MKRLLYKNLNQLKKKKKKYCKLSQFEAGKLWQAYTYELGGAEQNLFLNYEYLIQDLAETPSP